MPAPKTVLITGCSDGGIGSALAHAFRRRGGFHVFASARSVAKMGSLRAGPDLTLLELDVASEAQVAAAAELVRGRTGGRLDVLVNNAAQTHFMPLLDESVADVRRLFDANVFGPLRVTKAFAPLLVAAAGAVVGISSVNGYVNMPWMGSYGASKRAMEVMNETLRLELEPFGVRVLSIVTGPVDSNGMSYFEHFELPPDSIYKGIEPVIKRRANGEGRPDKMETPDEFAANVVPIILRGRSGLVWGPGTVASLVRFASVCFPSWLVDSIMRRGTGVDELSKSAKRVKSA